MTTTKILRPDDWSTIHTEELEALKELYKNVDRYLRDIDGREHLVRSVKQVQDIAKLLGTLARTRL